MDISFDDPNNKFTDVQRNQIVTTINQVLSYSSISPLFSNESKITVGYGDSTQWNGHELIVDPANISAGSQTDGVSGAIYRGFDRTIFHELIHSISTGNDPTPYDMKYNLSDNNFTHADRTSLNVGEEVAIFAENLIYSRATGQPGRIGHGGWHETPGAAPSIGGVSATTGTATFDWVGNQDNVGFDLVDGLRFYEISADGTRAVFKTYHSPTELFGSHAYDNYVTISGYHAGGFLTASAAAAVGRDGDDQVVAGLMGAWSVSASSPAAALISDVSAVHANDSVDLSQPYLAGLSDDRYYDTRRIQKDDPSGGHIVYDFHGLIMTRYSAEDANHNRTALDDNSAQVGTIYQSADGYQDGVILLGAGGDQFSKGNPDELHGSDHNDLIMSNAAVSGTKLYGGDGADILIAPSIGASASPSGIELHGDGGDDVLMSRGGSILMDGGENTDTAYYGLSTSPITVHAATGSGTVDHAGGRDTLQSIEHVFGTHGNDDFYLPASSDLTIFGGGGFDTFHGVGSGTIIATSGRIILDGPSSLHIDTGADATTGGTFSGINNFTGSDGDDFFYGGRPQTGIPSNVTVHGGGGNDFIESWGINSFGDAGNDTIKLMGVGGNYGGGTIDGGGDTDTLDLSAFTGSGVSLNVSLTGDWFIINNGSSHSDPIHFYNFERLELGGIDVSITGSGLIEGSYGKTNITGSDGPDHIMGHGTSGTLSGGNGSDVIETTGGESLFGGAGADNLYGGDLGNYLDGGADDDFIQGGASQDVIDGGTGNNELHGGGGYDHFILHGGGDNDVFGAEDGGYVDYAFRAKNNGSPPDPDLLKIMDMGDHFDVWTTADAGKTHNVDHLYGIDYLHFSDTSFNLTSGFSYDSHLYGF